MNIIRGAKKLNELGVRTIGNAGAGLAERFVGGITKPVEEGNNWIRKLTPLGRAAVVGGIGVGFMNGAVDARQQNDLGTSTGRIETATPSTAEYLQRGVGTAGADGSLVFALDKNKRGGYL